MSKRRTGLGSNPLDAIVPSAVSSRQTREPKPPRRRDPSARPPSPDRKVRATFHVPAALVEEARSAVIALAGPPVRLTLAALVESALRQELERLSKAHNKGKPWPRASAPLVGGRPIGG